MLDLTPYLRDIGGLHQQAEEQRRALSSEEFINKAPQLAEAMRTIQTTQGYWRDVIVHRDGSVEATEWSHNLVVNVFANLAAALVLGNGAGGLGTVYSGVQYMAVGTGLVAWDTSTPAPILTDVQLVTELARKVVSVQFVDSLGNVVAGPVNTILVTCTFNVGEANGDLREWGLFGGNATAIVNSGIMVDHVNTTKLTKPSGVSDFSLTRLVTLIF